MKIRLRLESDPPLRRHDNRRRDDDDDDDGGRGPKLAVRKIDHIKNLKAESHLGPLRNDVSRASSPIILGDAAAFPTVLRVVLDPQVASSGQHNLV